MQKCLWEMSDFGRRHRRRPLYTGADDNHDVVPHLLESLEPRWLMSVSVTDNIDDQNLDPNDPAIVLDLNTHFTDDATSDRFVRFDSAVGSFFIELFPDITPITVANFLNYVLDGRLNDTIIHRSISDFVIQGGGFSYISDADSFESVPTDPPIVNEFEQWFTPGPGGLDPGAPLNTRATLAMAKVGGDPDSATSGFFVNLIDNSANLDAQNGGFTVFAEIRGGPDGAGMAIVDAIAALPTNNFGAAFSQLPLLDDTADPLVTKSNLVLFSKIETSDLGFELVSNDNPDIVEVVVEDDGTLTITPTGLAGGTATIIVRSTDMDDETTASDTFAVIVDGSLLARDDLILAANDIDPVVIDILANDGGITVIDPTTVTIVDQPDLGDLVVDPATGVVTYTPRPEYVDHDTFSYTVMDVHGSTSNEATVTVLTEKAPVAADDNFESSDVNATIEIDILANDTDFNGDETIDATTVAINQAPAIGTASIDPATGIVTYTFNDGMGGDDNFTYTVNDTSGLTSNVATVNVSVQTDPVAENDAVSVDIPTGPIAIDILENDTDDNGDDTIDATTVDIITDPTNGTLIVDPVTGEVTYTPDPDIGTDGGNDEFAYTVMDTTGRVSPTALVTIAIEAAPVVTDNIVERIVGDLTADVVFSVLYDATDANGNGTIDVATLAVSTPPTSGTIAIDPDSGYTTYTPDPGFTGNDSFTYTVMDDTGRTSNTATVTLDIRIPPVAGNDEIVIPLDLSPVAFDILANDTDDNGVPTIDRATLTIVEDADEGIVTIDPDTQVITYTPGPAFDGGDSFTYTVADDVELESDVATVAVGFAAGTLLGTFFNSTDLTITINGVDVTFRLTGNGLGTVACGGGEDIDVDLAGTDTKSRHAITTSGGDNTFLVHDITADGSIASITAATTDLGGDVTIPGTITSIHMANVAGNHTLDILGTTSGILVHLVFADVVDLVINSGIAIQTLIVDSWTDTDNEQDAINAPAINKKLHSRGAFEANLNLSRSNGAATTLASARIDGTMSNVTWTITGNVGSIITETLNSFALIVNRDADFGGIVRTLRFGQIFGTSNITVEGAIFSFTAANWSAGTLQAEQVRSIRILGIRGNRLVGNFNADLTLTGGTIKGHRVSRVQVVNTISTGTWTIDGTVGSIQATEWDQGELNAVSVQSISIRRDNRNNTGGNCKIDMTLQGGTAHRRLGRLFVERQVRTSTWVIDGPVGAMIIDTMVRLKLTLNASVPLFRVGRATESNITVTGRITRLLAEEWNGGSITATSMGLLRITGSRRSLGSFSGDVTLTGDTNRLVLGQVRIFGVITGGDFNLAGTAGTVLAFRWDAGSFTTQRVKNIIMRAPNWFGPTSGDMTADLVITGDGDGKPVRTTLSFEGAIYGGNWNIATDVNRLAAATTILAWSANITGRVQSVLVRGHFAGLLSAASFGSIDVRGELNRATILAGADLGEDVAIGGTDADADTYGSGTIDRLTIRSRVRSSTLGAGLDPSNDRFNDGDDVIHGGTDSFLKKLTIRGTLDEDTLIGAGMYPDNIVIEGRSVPSNTVDNLL